MTSDGMLVRAAGGDWERLSHRAEVPSGGFSELFGEDLGPVIGTAKSLPVLAVSPVVAGAAPDVVCGGADGSLALVRLALGEHAADQILPELLGAAGAFHGMTLDEFVRVCGVAKMDELASRVMGGTPPKASRESWSAKLAQTLSSGRFELVGLVTDLPESVLAPMRFLNHSGSAQLRCIQVQLYSSASVTALQLSPLDTGLAVGVGSAESGRAAEIPGAGASQTTASGASRAGTKATPGARGGSRAEHSPGASSSSAKEAAVEKAEDRVPDQAMLLTEIARSSGDQAANLARLLVSGLERTFDDCSYENANGKVMLHATMAGLSEQPLRTLEVDGAGVVHVNFESLGPMDGDWSIRAELAQGMERLLGADLGDVRKISKLNVVIAEHLMDATLMEAFVEVIGDVMDTIRKDVEATARRAKELEAAAAAA